MSRFTRRSFLAGAASTLLFPRMLRAAGQRRFLFVYCYGGWDTTRLFTPAFDISGVDVESDATTAAAGSIPFVDHPDRPSVAQFFSKFSDRICLINGMEVRSVAHFRCRDILLTGGGENRDDWASIIAGSATAMPMPHLILKGPAFNSRLTGHVVRVGSDGQLPALLSGAAMEEVDEPITPLAPSVEALQDAWLSSRLTGEDDFSARYSKALEQLSSLESADDIDLSGELTGCSRSLSADGLLAVNAFTRGLSRCAMIQNDGVCDSSWDTHSENEQQSDHLESLFEGLLSIGSNIDSQGLWDDITLVVVSEMGRHPQLNAWGGKDHWTYTSVMMLGAGVAGGQVIGAMDGNFEGQALNLSTGAVSSSGEILTPSHLGATLLTLADIDPAEWIDADPLTAVLS